MLIGSANLRKMIIMAEKSLSTLYKRARKLQDFFRMIIHISLPYTAKTIGTSSGGGGGFAYTRRDLQEMFAATWNMYWTAKRHISLSILFSKRISEA